MLAVPLSDRFGACHLYGNKHPQDIEFVRTTILSMKVGDIERRRRSYRSTGLLSKRILSSGQFLSVAVTSVSGAGLPL